MPRPRGRPPSENPLDRFAFRLDAKAAMFVRDRGGSAFLRRLVDQAMGAAAPPLVATTPLPEFVLGEDADLREWLVRLASPRFACRVREEDFTEAELEGEERFLYFFGAGSAFSNLVWFDPEPTGEVAESLFERAADFIESFDD